MTLLVDTGACTTIISSKAYTAIPESYRPRLKPTTLRLLGADGGDLSVDGRTTGSLTFGQRKFRMSVVVAGIGEDGILGMDFLKRTNSFLDVGNSLLICENEEIVLYPKRSIEPEAEFLVRTLDSVEIPPRHQATIPITVSGSQGIPMLSVVEGTTRYEGGDLAIARTLIDTTAGDTARCLRVMNLGVEPIVLPGSTVLGRLTAVSTIRAMDSNEENTCPDDEDPKTSVPDHVQQLYETSIEHLNPTEATRFAELLTKHSNAFSKTDEDLGQTDLVQHEVNTGDHAPIRQPPRLPPLSKRKETEDLVHDMHRRGLIERSRSPWSSPIVLVKKKTEARGFVWIIGASTT
ncbi:uncharacterized protein LOC141911531 [Tubulanus polymorphus]|uniref:uncharacterized protein LOC141911531 n=1 Tax=Tubulanus polymorphus TaxID=672921 RepID=UPI003DA26147